VPDLGEAAAGLDEGARVTGDVASSPTEGARASGGSLVLILFASVVSFVGMAVVAVVLPGFLNEHPAARWASIGLITLAGGTAWLYAIRSFFDFVQKRRRLRELWRDVDISKEGRNIVRVSNDLGAVQQFSFEGNVLFKIKKWELNAPGEEILDVFGAVLREHMRRIEEVQIHGHASSEPRKTSIDKQNFTALRFGGSDDLTLYNLTLASNCALEVFKFLIENIRINPLDLTMSYTSYGEFMPVERSNAHGLYSFERLAEHNNTVEKGNRNRRVEVLLFYRLE